MKSTGTIFLILAVIPLIRSMFPVGPTGDSSISTSDATSSSPWDSSTRSSSGSTRPTRSWYTSTSPHPDFHTDSIICKNSAVSFRSDEGNSGDLICAAHARSSPQDELLVRDTVINYEHEKFLIYRKYFDRMTVTSVNVLNFGRHHAFTTSVDITNRYGGWYHGGKVDVRIEVPIPDEVRLFVEIYGRRYGK